MGNALSSARKTTDGIPYHVQDDFNFVKRLGAGGEGEVWKCIEKGFSLRKQNMSVKFFKATNISIYSKREIETLKILTHPNIVKLFGLIWDGQSSLDNPIYTGYVMEYMELGSLHDAIYDTSQRYGLGLVITWIRQIGWGLQYLHENGIIHRDVKPGNILLVKRNHIKLADFGRARNISSSKTYTTGPIGTDPYMAPEIVGDEKNYGPPADVYSFGITIWEIIHRKGPYGFVEFPMDPDKINDDCANFLKRCWTSEISERPTVKEIIEFWETYSHTIMVVLHDDTNPLCKIMVLDRNVPGYKWKLAHQVDFRVNSDAIGHKYGFVPCADGHYLIGGGKSRKNLFKIKLPMANQTGLTCQRLANMNHGREYISQSCFEWNGFLWVFGGFKYGYVLRSVERYDPQIDEWTIVTEMKYARRAPAAAVCNRKIIICGGRGVGGIYMNSVECFDPESGVWTELTSMPDFIYSHSLLYYKNMLVRVGGFNNGFISTVLAFNPDEKNGQWLKLEDMNAVFDRYSTDVLDQEIFVFGQRMNTWEVLIYNGNNWRSGPSFPLQNGKSCVSNLAMVVSQDYADSLLNNVPQEPENDLTPLDNTISTVHK